IYINLRLLWPAFLKKGNYFGYFFWLASSLVVYVGIKNAHDVYLYGNVLDISEYKNFLHHSLYNFSIASFYLAFSVALQLSKEWYFQRQLLQRIEIEKLNTELAYLKAQVNPHFLFNSLNTVFFQIEKTNIKARETLSKFSDMLRYQLYECNGNEVSVEKEIAYLRNYVDLQRLRSNDNYFIEFSATDNLNGHAIAPLILIPFVENAFKYVSHFTDAPNEVKIQLHVSDKNFEMRVLNTRSKTGTPQPGGIGLKNVQRRLALLYPQRHQLTMIEEDGLFEVNLQLTTL
ncbi:MAG TPA: histidine kinase, partial [Cyclobacteriaceae bacterium]|nr:histidine kinase [Cyclobacteriaceae bacterium]